MRPPDYTAYLESLDASWTEVGGKNVVRDFGSLTNEALAIRKLAVADRSERDSVVAYGDDVVELIQGLSTNNLFELAEEGSGQRNLAVNINGRLVFDMRLLHLGGMILMDLEPGVVADGRLGHFKKNVINEDAKFHDRSGGVSKILLSGDDAADVLTTVLDLTRNPKSLETFHGCAGTTSTGEDAIVQRIDFGSVPAFEIMVIDEVGKSLFKDFIERGATPVGEAAQESVRVSEGVSRFAIDRDRTYYGAELSDDVIPLEADLESLIDFTKGCYLGQEIIARLDSRGEPAKLLRRAVVDVGPKIGAKVTVDDKSRGTVVSSVPIGNQWMCGVFVKRDFNDIGSPIVIDDQSAVLQSWTPSVS